MSVNRWFRRFRVPVRGARRPARGTRLLLLIVAALLLTLAGCGPLPAATPRPQEPAPTPTSQPTAAPAPTAIPRPTAAAQPATTTEEKIRSAMSAMPAAIAKDATIVDYPPAGQTEPVVLRKGTNNWTCYPDFAGSPGNDPECNDPIFEGWSRALLAGEKAPPAISKPGLAYMLQGGSDASETDPFAAEPAAGLDWVSTPSHLMLLLPAGFDVKQFPADPNYGGPYVMWPGTTYVHLMVPVAAAPSAAASSVDEKIRSAMSAMPAAVAKDATIVDFPPAGQTEPVVLRKGTNNWTCYPDFAGSPGNDPECNDPIFEGWSRALLAGEKAPPAITKPGLAYMLQGGSDPSETDPFATEPAAGQAWVSTPPHMMLLLPEGFDVKQFPADPTYGGPYVMWPSTTYVHLMVPVAAAPSAAASSLDLTPTPQPAKSALTHANLYGVWGSSNNDIFAVGAGGTILHYDGKAWSPMNSGTTKILYNVRGTTASDVFAVGDGGTLLHYDGKAWSPMQSGTIKELDSVWGSSGSDVFASGSFGTILHYDGKAWSPMKSGTDRWLLGVWGSSAMDVFVAGVEGTILHYDGSAWSPMQKSTPDGPDCYGVWGSSGSDVFVSGKGGMMMHYDGKVWSPMNSGTKSGLNAGWASSSTDVYVTGELGTILHYDGSAWSPMKSGTLEGLSSVWGSSGDDVFATGHNGTILHYDGKAWSPMSGSTG